MHNHKYKVVFGYSFEMKRIEKKYLYVIHILKIQNHFQRLT